MFDDDFDNYEPTEEDLKNPHLKEFVIKDDETMQRLIDIIEGPPTVSMDEIRRRREKSGVRIATKEDIRRLFDAIDKINKKEDN